MLSIVGAAVCMFIAQVFVAYILCGRSPADASGFLLSFTHMLAIVLVYIGSCFCLHAVWNRSPIRLAFGFTSISSSRFLAFILVFRESICKVPLVTIPLLLQLFESKHRPYLHEMWLVFRPHAMIYCIYLEDFGSLFARSVDGKYAAAMCMFIAQVWLHGGQCFYSLLCDLQQCWLCNEYEANVLQPCACLLRS